MIKYLSLLSLFCFSALAGLPPIQTQNQGSRITPITTSLNFTGSGVTASASGNAVTVNITGSSSVSGSSTIEAQFVLNDACVPFINIDGPHQEVNTKTLSLINLSMLNSGNAGSSTVGNSTVIQINQYRSGSSTVFATRVAAIPGNGGNTNSVQAVVSAFPSWAPSSLSLSIGDIVTVDVLSCSGGLPEAVRAEY